MCESTPMAAKKTRKTSTKDRKKATKAKAASSARRATASARARTAKPAARKPKRKAAAARPAARRASSAKAAKRRKPATKRATTRKAAATTTRRKTTRSPSRTTRTSARKKSATERAKKATRAAAKRSTATKARKAAAKAKATRATKLKATKTRASKAKAARVKARVAKTRGAKVKARAAKARTARTKATTRARVAKPRATKARATAARSRTTKTRLMRVKATRPRLAKRKVTARAERTAVRAEKTRLSEKPKLKEKLKLQSAAQEAAEVERPRRSSDKPQRASDRPVADKKKLVRPGAAAARVKGASPSSERRPGRSPLRETPRVVSLPLPMLPPPRRPTVEERSANIEQRLNAQTEEFRRRYTDSFDMSWIYHDSALEGVVYTFEELRAALSGQAPAVTDSSLQPTYDDIRRHKEAINYVREFGANKRLPVTLDCVKKLYLILHPEEGDLKTVKYRKDIPQHRLYFHEYAPPDKIAYKVRQIIDWLNDPETRKTRNGIRIAARAHYDLLRVYPFPSDSGKVARLFMNMLLLRSGLPPSIIHSTERQRYYEALKGSATTVLQMVQESVENALASVEKLLDEHETRKRAFVS